MGDQSTRSEYRWNNRAKGCGFASVQKCLHPCVVILELTVCVCMINSEVALSELILISFMLPSSKLTWPSIFSTLKKKLFIAMLASLFCSKLYEG